MSRDSLLLTLGHNSSAILVRDEKIVGGYETERLTGVKSDSAFPRAPIDELRRWHGLSHVVDLYVSHWEVGGDVNAMTTKHWDRKFANELSNGGMITSVNQFFTHHDAHAWSAVAFAGEQFPCAPKDSTYIFVVDGFGTYGEHMSFYRLVDNIPVLIERKFGFGGSMGLLYQYTTSFLGLKQNADEYKLLAFEPGVDLLGGSKLRVLDELIDSWTEFYVNRSATYMEADPRDPMLAVGALPNTATEVANTLEGVVKATVSETVPEQRAVISHFTQTVVEGVLSHFVEKFKPKNLLLVGGTFFNVKLNNRLSRMVPGKTCVMPLAGDQGCAIGLYKAVNQDFKWAQPGHLFWGKRDLDRRHFDGLDGVHHFTNRETAYGAVKDVLMREGYVNVVDGAVEFGPRALCHTTTFGLPNRDVADTINAINGRVGEMPFAPCVTTGQLEEYFEETERVHRSLEYMIMTRDYRPGMHVNVTGAAHKYPRQERYSGRPQVVGGQIEVIKMLQSVGTPLINTSYNVHSQPIVCTPDQIKRAHTSESTKAMAFGLAPPTLIVIDDRED